MNTRILNALKQTTLIEEKQKASHCFVEDMPPYAINQELSLKAHGRVLSNYFLRIKTFISVVIIAMQIIQLTLILFWK